MTLPARLLLITAILGATLVVQSGLNWHMRGGEETDYADLRKPISDLPLTIPPVESDAPQTPNISWIGATNEKHQNDIRAQLPFEPNGLLSRTYELSDKSLALHLYMVYSRQADDRKHHPEICIRDVAGKPEILEARKILFVNSDPKRPIQRFRFQTSNTHHTTVYYCHFTFPRVPRPGETALQVLHQQLSRQAPSITVQVSTMAEIKTTAESNRLEPIESVFLPALDKLLQESYLPKGTVMGCDRVPIVLVTR